MATRGPAQLSDWSWIDQATADRLKCRVEQGLRRARGLGGPVVVSVTAVPSGSIDPSAAVMASRRGDEPWFCLEQPDRNHLAVAGLGCVTAIAPAGNDRFRSTAEAWRALARAALADAADDVRVPGGGLIAVGGFAFAPGGGGSPQWRGFGDGSLVVPELSLARCGPRTELTLTLEINADDTADQLLERARRRLRSLCDRPLPLTDPAPVGRYEVASAMPPIHYEDAVARAVERIRAGELDKVVLAREVDVHAPRSYNPAAVFGLLRTEYPSSYVYAVGREDAVFLGATPELLVRREGQRVSTVALAGSTRRSADPAVDDHLGERLLRSDKDRRENAIVADRIVRALRPHAVWVTAAPEPVVIKVANIQHLAAPVRAQLTASIDAIEVAGLLHPTPAVGAEPPDALRMIPALEGFDRGWYAGAVGWTDATGDGEFCVALRCALLAGPVARCYAGCGIVADSDPASELAETEIKLRVMLPALVG